MPPFSSDINHQANHYCNDNTTAGSVAGPPTAEGKAFLGREQEIDEDCAPGVSDSVAKRPASEALSSQSESEPEEKNDKESNDTSNLDPIGRSFEAKNLHVESVLNAFEDNQVYDYNADYLGYSYHEQGYNYMHNQPTSFIFGASIGSKNVRSLFTIPEQRVSFAGKVFGGILIDDLQVNLIPHVQEYTLEYKRSMWYTRKELKAIRKTCFHTARVVSRDAELYCPYFIRGLEHLVEQYRRSYDEIEKDKIKKGNNEENEIDSESKCDGCCDSSSTSESRRLDAVEAVLFEQERQRRMSLETNRIQHGGIRDPEKIQYVYKTKGKTKRSQSIARAKALRDEACVKEWLMEAPLHTVNGRQEPAHYYSDGNVDHCETHNSAKGLSTNVRQVFHNLVTPFLDIPEGDIYIEMGDEYFLTQV
uniref:Uncharacterized protein n=1 Tax=Pseudo-nitzschia delicatissima TaxID=44447 RepID=A0A7S0TDW1_9STRA|mmetsp:Transcript_819/g.1876  ORF Transcript_819/g.1876 Transcript_819/m.1876 type:complete len:419 (+) Transcript_819:1403-2659(+)